MEALKISDLADACQMARDDSDLEITSQTNIENLQAGDFVKLSHEGERFKVKIEKILIKGKKFVGSIRSDLFFKHPFKFGDFIELESKNIFDVYSLPSVETKMAKDVYKKPVK